MSNYRSWYLFLLISSKQAVYVQIKSTSTHMLSVILKAMQPLTHQRVALKTSEAVLLMGTSLIKNMNCLHYSRGSQFLQSKNLHCVAVAFTIR